MVYTYRSGLERRPMSEYIGRGINYRGGTPWCSCILHCTGFDWELQREKDSEKEKLQKEW